MITFYTFYKIVQEKKERALKISGLESKRTDDILRNFVILKAGRGVWLSPENIREKIITFYNDIRNAITRKILPASEITRDLEYLAIWAQMFEKGRKSGLGNLLHYINLYPFPDEEEQVMELMENEKYTRFLVDNRYNSLLAKASLTPEEFFQRKLKYQEIQKLLIPEN